MSDDLRLGAAGLRIVRAFVADPRREWSGAELSRETKTGSGTMYPLLAKLEQHGWVTPRWEEVDPKEVGRPRRRYYTLTGIGVRNARNALAEFQIPSSGEIAWST